MGPASKLMFVLAAFAAALVAAGSAPAQRGLALHAYVAHAPSCKSTEYKNSSGKCVHVPSSDPTGATAKCGDGTYSYSQHASGTCSHHGGVARWIHHP
jgi:hypothetical protein